MVDDKLTRVHDELEARRYDTLAPLDASDAERCLSVKRID